MDVTQSVVHASYNGDLETSCTSTSPCSSFLSTEIHMEPNETTPLLTTAAAPSSASNSTAERSIGTGISIKECLNWRTIGLLLMFMVAVVLAAYLLWKETISFPDIGYKLNLIQHDIWSRAHLKGQALLETGHVVNVFITHTASGECTENCAELLHGLQRKHLGELPYNFLMAGDCEVYEARGWKYVSSFGSLPQASSLVLGFVGDFSWKGPTNCQIQMAQALLWESLRRLKLQPGYQLYALSNTSRSSMDADALQQELKYWPYYAGQRKEK